MMLDCYNDMVQRDVSVTITTRFDSCYHYFYVEIYECDNL